VAPIPAVKNSPKLPLICWGHFAAEVSSLTNQPRDRARQPKFWRNCPLDVWSLSYVWYRGYLGVMEDTRSSSPFGATRFEFRTKETQACDCWRKTFGERMLCCYELSEFICVIWIDFKSFSDPHSAHSRHWDRTVTPEWWCYHGGMHCLRLLCDQHANCHGKRWRQAGLCKLLMAMWAHSCSDCNS